MKPLRFCMVTTFYPPYNFGGDGMFVQNLSHALVKSGHQVDVIHCADSYRIHATEPVQPVENRAGIRIHTLRSPFGFLSPLATQLSGQSFLKTGTLSSILNENFDVIHYHNISLIGASVLALGKSIKLYTTHEYWLVCPTHTLFKFNREVCEQPECTRCSLTYLRPPQLWRKTGLLNSALTNVDAFLFPSRSSMDLHQRAGFQYPSIHLPEFAPELVPLEVSDGPPDQGLPYFLFVGRLEKLKGLETLIPLFRRYGRARLLIAGDGGMAPDLIRLAGGAENIEFLGHTSSHRLRTLYRDAVALVVPSMAYETFSLVTVEAFREGTPVIARNLGGPKELIEQSGGGLLFNSPEEMEAALNRLLDNRPLRDELGARGQQAYRQNWTDEVHVRQYLSIIEGIAAVKYGSAAGPAFPDSAGGTPLPAKTW